MIPDNLSSRLRARTSQEFAALPGTCDLPGCGESQVQRFRPDSIPSSAKPLARFFCSVRQGELHISLTSLISTPIKRPG